MPKIVLLAALLLAACAQTAPSDTPPQTPAGLTAAPPGQGIGGATSLAPPGPRYGSRSN
jgi:hypothetical protein